MLMSENVATGYFNEPFIKLITSVNNCNEKETRGIKMSKTQTIWVNFTEWIRTDKWNSKRKLNGLFIIMYL